MTTLTHREVAEVEARVSRLLRCDFKSYCYETVKWQRVDKSNPYNQYRCQKHYKVDERRYRRWDEDAYQRNVRFDPDWKDPDPAVERHARDWEPVDYATERANLLLVATAKALTEKRADEVVDNARALARAEKAFVKAAAEKSALALDLAETSVWQDAYTDEKAKG